MARAMFDIVAALDYVAFIPVEPILHQIREALGSNVKIRHPGFSCNGGLENLTERPRVGFAVKGGPHR